MNQKTYRVWNVLLEHPNEWMYISEMAGPARLTARQVTSIISGLDHTENIRKEHTKYGTMVQLTGTDAELGDIRSHVVRMYHGIDDDFVDMIYSVLSPCGWVTVTDIAYDTGLKPIKISAALTTMPDVRHRMMGSTQVYARCE